MSRLLAPSLFCALLAAPNVHAEQLTEITPTAGYLDNRSTAQDLVLSYYNAIALGQYARAFSYTLRSTPDQSADDLAEAYAAFSNELGQNTKVTVRIGEAFTDAGAGTEVTVIPVIVSRGEAAGQHAGCHHVVQLSPSDQDYVPFDAIRIDHSQMTPFTGDFNAEPMPDCRF